MATYGLCAPAVLLAGRDEKGRHVLVLEKIEKAVDALTAVNTAVSPEAEQVILHRVFAAIARLHQAGIAQYDLHLGNFLLTDDYVYAIDPACMRFGHKPIPSAKSRRQLAMILATLRFGNFTTYRELVEAYCTARGLSYSPELLEVVQTLTERRRQKMMPHALKKTLRNSKSFRVLKTPRGRTIFNAAVFDVDSMHRLIRDLEVVFRNGRYAGENAAGRTVISVFEGRQYTVTRYNSLSGWQRIAAIFCSSAARRQWLTLWKTRYSGKPSLVPVALIDPRPALSLKTAWLVAYNADQKAP